MKFCAKRQLPPSLRGSRYTSEYALDFRAKTIKLYQVARTFLIPIPLLPALQIFVSLKIDQNLISLGSFHCLQLL